MARFSERIGIVEPKPLVQIEGMTLELRNSLWNLIYGLYENRHKDYWRQVAQFIAEHFRKVPVDELPYRDYECRDWVKDYFFKLEWHEVYDLVEFIDNNHIIMTRQKHSPYKDRYIYHSVKPDQIKKAVNTILQGELTGFRFISGTRVPISDEAEVIEVEEATPRSKTVGLSGTTKHIRTALELFGKKPNPDYRNATKEAISAVESAVKQLSGANSSGLDGALDELSRKTSIHGALKSAFKKLYGYTSDEDGIRHAILEENEVGFDEAKYMIVACSAFVNFLISKADAADLLP